MNVRRDIFRLCWCENNYFGCVRIV